MHHMGLFDADNDCPSYVCSGSFLCFSEMMNPPASISCRTDPPPEWSNQTDCRLDFGWALHLLTQFGIPWLERWDVFFRFFSYRLGHLMATHSIIERNRQPRPFFLSAIWPRAKAAKPLPCPALRFGGLKGLLRR